MKKKWILSHRDLDLWPKVTKFNRVRASAISNHWAKTASKSVHPFGWNFVHKNSGHTDTQTHRQTDRQTHTHTDTQTNWSENITPPRFRWGVKIEMGNFFYIRLSSMLFIWGLGEGLPCGIVLYSIISELCVLYLERSLSVRLYKSMSKVIPSPLCVVGYIKTQCCWMSVTCIDIFLPEVTFWSTFVKPISDCRISLSQKVNLVMPNGARDITVSLQKFYTRHILVCKKEIAFK